MCGTTPIIGKVSQGRTYWNKTDGVKPSLHPSEATDTHTYTMPLLHCPVSYRTIPTRSALTVAPKPICTARPRSLTWIQPCSNWKPIAVFSCWGSPRRPTSRVTITCLVRVVRCHVMPWVSVCYYIAQRDRKICRVVGLSSMSLSSTRVLLCRCGHGGACGR